MFAPLFLVMAFVAALGVGLFLSAVNVRYRDVPYAIPVPASRSGSFSRASCTRSTRFRSVAVGARSQSDDGGDQRVPVGSLGAGAPDLGKTLVSVAATVVFLVVGLWYFRRSEPRFADTI